MFFNALVLSCDLRLVFVYIAAQRTTLPETNIAPENDPLEKEIPIAGKGDSYWKPSFLGAMLVLGRVSSIIYCDYCTYTLKNCGILHWSNPTPQQKTNL